MEDAVGLLRVLVAVDPPVLEELLVTLLDEPGISVLRSGEVAAGSVEPFDVVIRNRSVLSARPADSVIELNTPTGTGPAVVSTSAGDTLVHIEKLADLRAVLLGLRRP